MNTYVTRITAVQATQITEADFTGDHPNDHHVPDAVYIPTDKRVAIATVYGQQLGKVGDWIVKDKNGLHILRPDQFAATYTPANESKLDVALAEVAYLRGHLAEAPNPVPGVKWDSAYINWYYRFKRAEAERKAGAA